MAKSTTGTYKNTVWKACADYIKAREADIYGMVKCVTCDLRMHFRDHICNAGHFVPGRGNAVLFDDAHIFPQCSGCNCDGGGEQYKFGLFLKERYGYDDATIDEIRYMRHKTRKFTMDELKEMKRRFDAETKRICKEKGIV